MSFQATVWVLEHSDAQGAERLVLLALANHAGASPIDGAWEAYPGIEVIAEEARLDSPRTVQNALTRLVNTGQIERVVNAAPDRRIPNNQRPNLYRILTTPRPLRQQLGQRFSADDIAHHPCRPLDSPAARHARAVDAAALSTPVENPAAGVSSDDTPRALGVSSRDAQGCRETTRRGVVSRRGGVSSRDTQTVIEQSVEQSEEQLPNVSRAELSAPPPVENPEANGGEEGTADLPTAHRLAQRAATVAQRVPSGHGHQGEGTGR